MARELATTFDDTSLEMNATGDKFRVAQMLQNAVAANTSNVATNTGDIATNTAAIATLNARTITAGTGLTGGGNLSADRTIAANFGTAAGTVMQGNQAAGGDVTGTLSALSVTVARGIKTATTTVAVSAATAPTAGQVLTATSGTAANWQTPAAGGVPTTRTITAGTGLTGGGDLSADRTLSASFGTAAGTVMQGNQAAGGDASGTLNALNVTQARGLRTAGGTVSVDSGGLPTTGHALTAISSSAAQWSAILPTGQTHTVGRLTVDAILETPTGFTNTGSINLDVSIKNDFVINTGGMTGNLTLTLINPANGRQGIIAVRQDATGSRTITFSVAGYTLYSDPGTPDLQPSPTPNSITIYTYALLQVGGASIAYFSKITPALV